ncbi:methionine aminopeptidase, type I [Marininema mesophilum]|uniref:Methionine aminopeptidase n=1 Tax=Marininema mesophilum TaxID=1048340 RepID=A0A1H3C1M9_9BACL|nr:type I methionyl aminopeptidase [Marininema mesophilum]SDX47828.1 methionine aminopeptidase, type I [Marininema mesophilum]
MTTIRSKQELALMREAGKIVAECHALLAENLRPGISTKILDRLVEKWILKRGAEPSFKGHHGFPGSICVAINDVICHGFPTDTPLQEGDVVTLDVGARYQGYHGDSGWTYAVGKVTPEVKRLMEVGLESFHRGLEQVRPGNRIGDIGWAIQSYAEGEGYGVVREFTGHAVGQELWEEPPIPHFGIAHTGPGIESGMVLAVEPMITTGSWRAKVDADGWTARTVDGSLCVQYEHTIAVTDESHEILTRL